MWRGGQRYSQRFARGVPQTELLAEQHDDNERQPSSSSNGGGSSSGSGSRRRGTEVSFLYDDQIFSKR